MERADTFHLKEDGNHCLVLVKGKWKKKKKCKWLHWLQALRGGNTNTHQFCQLESHWLTATVMSSCIASSANYVQINISSAFPKETLLLGSTRLAEVWVSHHWISRYEEGMRTEREGKGGILSRLVLTLGYYCNFSDFSVIKQVNLWIISCLPRTFGFYKKKQPHACIDHRTPF